MKKLKDEITITLTIDKNTFLGMNGAIASYGEVIWQILFGLDIPKKLSRLKEMPEEELEKRYHSIKKLYEILEKEFEEEEEE